MFANILKVAGIVVGGVAAAVVVKRTGADVFVARGVRAAGNAALAAVGEVTDGLALTGEAALHVADKAVEGLAYGAGRASRAAADLGRGKNGLGRGFRRGFHAPESQAGIVVDGVVAAARG